MPHPRVVDPELLQLAVVALRFLVERPHHFPEGIGAGSHRSVHGTLGRDPFNHVLSERLLARDADPHFYGLARYAATVKRLSRIRFFPRLNCLVSRPLHWSRPSARLHNPECLRPAASVFLFHFRESNLSIGIGHLAASATPPNALETCDVPRTPI